MNWIFTMWPDGWGIRDALLKGSTFWLATAALILPFGWVLLLLRLEPVRVRVRSLFRR